ncbi:YHYH protein [Rhodobacteraceae bacterium NNCM2]|nr:YHYH protein [Coraliihabitans acroporae]
MTQGATRMLRATTVAASMICLSAGYGSASSDRLVEIREFFADAEILDGPRIVDCTLSKGTETECFSITFKADPQSYEPGPWCPTNVSDGPEKGGIWFDDGKVYDVDGAFLENLANFYGDTNWQLIDPETGNVRFTGTLEACEAAARPDVDPAYHNHCVQCLPEYMPEDASLTYVISLEPQDTFWSAPIRGFGAGVARNGVRLDGPAPLGAILGAYTIAPFDDCGGHVNPHVGYHYHAVTDCLEPMTEGAEADHAGPIGIAMDGYRIYPQLSDSEASADDLDRCNGHASGELGYHYHAGAPGSNAIIGCLKAEAGCTQPDSAASCNASIRPSRP